MNKYYVIISQGLHLEHIMVAQSNILLALVDDALVLRKLLGTYLGSRGFELVIEADNGQQFLDLLSNSAKMPEICLVDSNMPVMNGSELTRILSMEHPEMIIVGYSFLDDPASADLFLMNGACDFICKDMPAKEVREALIRIVSKCRA